MGLPMARNLLGASVDLAVHNRTRSKSDELVGRGALWMESPLALVRACDVVLVCLSSIEASREMFLGAEGLVAHARPGSVLIDHATVDMATSRDVYAAATARGVSFLDAPISGGPGGASDGTLSIMVGGDEEAFSRAKPALEPMGSTIVWMGPSGAGTATKLANQLLVGIHTVASCEAFGLARRAGVDLEKLLGVLQNSWGASRMLDRNAPSLIAESYGPSPVPVRNLHKDLDIIATFARNHGLELSLASEALAAFDELMREGRGEWDITAASLGLDDADTGATQ